MSNALPAREPSMDEILASIRRIIESDDEAGAPGTAPHVEHLHGEPANAPGNPADLPVDTMTWRDGAVSQAEEGALEPGVAEAGPAVLDAEASPATIAEIASPPGRPRLGIVPPAEPAGPMAAVRSDEAAEARPSMGAAVDGVAEIRGESDAQWAGMAQNDEEPRDCDELSAPDERLGAVSLAAVAARRLNEKETPGSVSDGDWMTEEADVADLVDEFDEDEFASELLENADLVSPEPHVAEQPDEDVPDRLASSAAATAAPEASADRARPDPESGTAVPENPTDAAGHELISRETGSRVGASFDNLARVIREEHLGSIDETVGEILRPMLQEWLDDNLPNLVEKLVREEIERVARGGRR